MLSGVWDPSQVVVGISGGLFGLFAIYIYILWCISKHNNDPGIKASLNSALLMLGINIAIGIIPGISMTGHIGGLVTGLLLAMYFVKSIKSQQKRSPQSQSQSSYRSYDEFDPH